MKSFIFLITLFFLIPFISIAQKQDFVWYSGGNFDGRLGAVGGATFFSFNDTSFSQMNILPEQSTAVRDHAAKATMADEEGNLLFFTDGFDIFNKNYEIMDNGDSVFNFHPSVAHWHDRPTGVNIYGWSLILPVPDSENKYVVLYQDLIITPYHRIYAKGLTYNMVDMNLNNGLGKVIEKKNQIFSGDIMEGHLTAIKHGNGRDWWIPIKHLDKPEWNVFILDPDGLRLSHIQEIEDLYFNYSPISNFDYSRNQMIYVAGDHYRFDPHAESPFIHEFHFLDFDRCAGLMSLDRQFEIVTQSWPIFHIFNIEISPSGKFLYFLDHGVGYVEGVQMDLTSPDPPSTLDTIFNSDELSYTRFGSHHLKITPQGEMWVLNWADPYITVVRNPELPVPQINLDPEPIETAWLNQGCFPNNANYRIGPIDGSPCDTLGIDNLPKAWFRHNDQNLEHSERRFTDLSYFRPETWHWDFDDGTTFDGQHPGVHDFPGPGEYFVCLTVSNENAEDTYCQWVIIDELSSTGEIEEPKDFVLYPNPSSGDFTLKLSETLAQASTVKVFDLLGREVHIQAADTGQSSISLSLGHLPGGQYMVQLKRGEAVMIGSIIITK